MAELKQVIALTHTCATRQEAKYATLMIVHRLMAEQCETLLV
jgi:hypothetical protein